MIWGGISLEGRTDLHVLNHGNLAGARNRDEIHRPIARPYAGAVSRGFLLVHDNAQPHVIKVCQWFIKDEGIDTLNWRARSADPSPPEHL